MLMRDRSPKKTLAAEEHHGCDVYTPQLQVYNKLRLVLNKIVRTNKSQKPILL